MWTSPANVIVPCLFSWVSELDASDECTHCLDPQPLVS